MTPRIQKYKSIILVLFIISYSTSQIPSLNMEQSIPCYNSLFMPKGGDNRCESLQVTNAYISRTSRNNVLEVFEKEHF